MSVHAQVGYVHHHLHLEGFQLLEFLKGTGEDHIHLLW